MPSVYPLPFLAAVQLAALLMGYNGHRVAQMAALMLPALLWLWFPLTSARGRALQLVLAGLSALVVLTDSLVRGFLWHVYQAELQSTLVMTALANTHTAEASEYLQSQQSPLMVWAGLWLAGLAATFWALRAWWLNPPAKPVLQGKGRVLWFLLLALVVAAFVTKSTRRHHPLVFWPSFYDKVSSLQTGWKHFGVQRQALLERAAGAGLSLSENAPDTVLLVISESVTRDNLGMYGYPRNTTPALPGRLGESGLVFRHAWSSAASTIPSLRDFFYMGEPDARHPQHLLALAKAAGYRIYWIGNQNDLAIEQEHAGFADKLVITNLTTGRSGGLPDEVVLPKVRELMAESAPRKLMVVHLLGAHPHYRLRYPEGFPEIAGDDAIEQALETKGRSIKTRILRREYDSTLRYENGVVAELLAMLQAQAGRNVFFYTSDHGQEVGETEDHAGHSPMTESGYRIPMVAWRTEGWLPQQQNTAASEAVRLDWMSWSLMGLMGIDWSGMKMQRDALNAAYEWHAPALPFQARFRE
jgi:heptose-I-phosphate ethanolaminephosphotransferase